MVGVRQPMAGVVYAPGEDLRGYVEAGLFSDETLGEAFSRVAEKAPGRVALSEAGVTMTFAEVDEATDRIAAGLLAMGLHPLDRAAFQVANGRQLVLSLLACLKAGVIPICTLTAHRRVEIGYLAEHAKARAHFICTDDPKFDFAAFAREMRDLVPSLAYTVVARGPSPDGDPSFRTLDALAELGREPSAQARLRAAGRDPFQVAVFQLSGGTSGIPKIIPRFHNEYLYQIRSVAALHGLDEHTVAFTPNPMMHNAPIICYWGSALWSGGEVVCSSSLKPEALAEALERRPNWMAIPLPQLLNLRDAGLLDRDKFRHARLVVSNHAPRFREMTGAEAVPLYGMTEGLISFGRIGDPTAVLDTTVGRPVSPLDEFRIVDPVTGEELPDGELGEFCFKGPSSTRGYYDAEERNREAFTADSFCKSGDLMRVHVIDGARYVSFDGRVKDVVSRGGEKINCQEVERVLIDHPSVGAISIVPMPDPVYGERSCAFVIPARGAAPPTVKELGAFLEGAGLAKFKWPERVEIVEEFPTTSSGKLSKPRLREMISATLQSEQEAGRAA